MLLLLDSSVGRRKYLSEEADGVMMEQVLLGLVLRALARAGLRVQRRLAGERAGGKTRIEKMRAPGRAVAGGQKQGKKRLVAMIGVGTGRRGREVLDFGVAAGKVVSEKGKDRYWRGLVESSEEDGEDGVDGERRDQRALAAQPGAHRFGW